MTTTIKARKATKTQKHPALTQHTVEDRLWRMRARLTLAHATYEARDLLGLDTSAANDEVARLIKDCLGDIEALGQLSGDILNTPTGGAR